jgi:hypothetical protein
VALPHRILLLVIAVLMALLLLVVAPPPIPTTEDSAGGLRVAEARPVIGGDPLGTSRRNVNADTNPGVDNRTDPNTGGPQR